MKFALIAILAVLFSSPLLAQPEQIFLLRHSEKSTGNNPALTEQGQQRAKNIAQQLAIANPLQLFSTDYKRTQQTIAPLAKELALEVTIYNPKDLIQFASQLKQLKGNAVVVGHSNTTPQLIKHLSGYRVNIEEDEYNKLFELRLHNGRYELIRLNTSALAL